MVNIVELTDFVVALSQDPRRARRFREAPNVVLEEATVSEETKGLLRSSREEGVRQILLSDQSSHIQANQKQRLP